MNYRRNVIVPNVSWGMGFQHECDMIVMDVKKRLTEVEIKVTKSDLMADFKKPHGHRSAIIGRLIYAVPTKLLETAKEVIPGDAGLIEAYVSRAGRLKARWIRVVKHKKCRELRESEVHTLYRLAAIRTWTLKKHLNNLQTRTKNG